MMDAARVAIIVLDSVGVGELPDAVKYGDIGCNTLGNTAKAVDGLSLPNFQELGLGNIISIQGVPPIENPIACYGKMAEVSAGKDTTTGHWELMGVHLNRAFPTYPNGFPPDIIEAFENKIGRAVLGNKPASGTEIIKELGERHMATGKPIVYTSADSVFQIAAHEQVIPVNELYRMCLEVRSLLTGEHGVARVIARPFIGQPGEFKRTHRRKDFSLPPPAKTVLDYAAEAGIEVAAVGKIGEIFAGRGIRYSTHTVDNEQGVDETINLLRGMETGLIFTNLVDFDMLWGHRNNFVAYARGLEAVDGRVPEIIENLRPTDCLFFVADHGCDPTTPSTDHTREYAPVLVYGHSIRKGLNLGVRQSFSDVGKTVADLLGFEAPVNGVSFASEIRRF